MIVRTYSEVIRLDSFEDRFDYLELKGVVGESTFGFDRYLNQKFYKSIEWQRIRDHVILRDQGMDLAHPDRPIFERPIVHHVNPMAVEDLVHKEEWVLDPEFLILTSISTHNAIHYGKERLPIPRGPREPGDTDLW